MDFAEPKDCTNVASLDDDGGLSKSKDIGPDVEVSNVVDSNVVDIVGNDSNKQEWMSNVVNNYKINNLYPTHLVHKWF